MPGLYLQTRPWPISFPYNFLTLPQSEPELPILSTGLIRSHTISMYEGKCEGDPIAVIQRSAGDSVALVTLTSSRIHRQKYPSPGMGKV